VWTDDNHTRTPEPFAHWLRLEPARGHDDVVGCGLRRRGAAGERGGGGATQAQEAERKKKPDRWWSHHCRSTDACTGDAAKPEAAHI